MSERERFIPHRVGVLAGELSRLPWDDENDAERFQAFTRLVAALYHYEFHDREQQLSELWDRVGDDQEAAGAVTAELTGLLDAGNYTAVTMAELDDALEQESLIPLRLEVDMDDYDEVLVYRRGSHQKTVKISKLKGLRSKDLTMTVDEEVVVHTRVKPQSWFDSQEIEAEERNLTPGHVSIKQFQSVPRADIEMLLPSTQVKFRTIDTLAVGVPAVVSGIIVLATKLLPTLGLIVLLFSAWLGFRDEPPELDQTALVILFGGAVTLGAFLFKQWTKLKNRRVSYLKTLTENLYFRTLGDGPGVFHTLLASAERQEVIEVILGYRFLARAPDGLTESQLDSEVEDWLRDTFDGDIDFEVDDAVGKLQRLGVVSGRRRLRAIPLPEALDLLDQRWDDLFQFAPASPKSAGSSRLERGAVGGDDDEEHWGSSNLIRLRKVVDRFGGRLSERRLQRESTPTDS